MQDIEQVETLAKLPDTSPVVFPTVAQQAKAIDLIAANWDRVVGVELGGDDVRKATQRLGDVRTRR